MAEYTDREELRAAMQHIFNDPTCPMHIAAEIEQIIDCAPATDVASVVHARWIDAPWLYYGAKQYVCSRCRNDKYWRKRDLHFKEPYCPNCGAKMDGGDSDATNGNV